MLSREAVGWKPFQATFGHCEAVGKICSYVKDSSRMFRFTCLRLSDTVIMALSLTELNRDSNSLYSAFARRRCERIVIVVAAVMMKLSMTIFSNRIFAALGFFRSSVMYAVKLSMLAAAQARQV